jgi:hypothetical protein
VARVFELKRIPIWPVVRVTFIVLLVVGILIGFFYGMLVSGIGYLIGTLGESPFGENVPLLGNLGFLMVPIIAVLYAVIGTIWVIIWVLIYNIAAAVVGGIELDLSPKESAFHGAAPMHPGTPHVRERPINGF